MSVDTAGSIIVLLHGNNTPIHEGHQALFDFAKTVGDKVVALVVRNVTEWYHFLRTGMIVDNPKTVTDKLVESLDAIGVPHVFQDPDFSVPEEKRQEVMDKMAELIQAYREQLYLKRIGEICQMMLADIVLRKPLGEAGRVKGPDVEAFVLKDVMNRGRLGADHTSQVHILPKMIKSASGLKIKRDKMEEGFMTQAQVEEFNYGQIGNIFRLAREQYKEGWNGPLVERLNTKYADFQKGLWKFYEIVVYEGGIFENYRVELTSFELPQPNGAVSLYEDWNVFQK